MWKALIMLVIYVSVIIIPVAVASILGHSSGNMLHELGKSFALAGFVILALQFFLPSRIKWIERPYGLDILIRFHKHMAVLGTVLLLTHPLLLVAGDAEWELIVALDLPWYIWIGKAALAFLIINVLLSAYQTVVKLKFEKWRFIHNVAGLVIIGCAFTHSWFTGDDLKLNSMRTLWIIILLFTAGIYVYHRSIVPSRLKRRYYHVIDIQPESEKVWTIKLAPPAGEKIPPYLPGQFHFITLYRDRNLPVEEHHWTISSSPGEKAYISSTIKALGDFTSTIGETEKGDRASVQGSFGRFSYVLHPEEKDLVFIVGGIGITPIMSMLRHMRDMEDNRSVLLLYANPVEDHIIFREELASIENGQYPLLKVVHVLSKPDDSWTGERGHIDREKIERFCGSKLGEKVFYVCGPQGMRKSVIASLRDLGVADKQIRVEIFSFLD